MPRVVLDTNVVVSALLFHNGSLTWLRLAWQSAALDPLASRDTTTELIRVLSYPKFRLSDDEREDLLGEYLPWCETVVVPDAMEVPHCRDPFDRPFLALALAAKADALVTGDGHLLEISGDVSVPIVTPATLQGWMPGLR